MENKNTFFNKIKSIFFNLFKPKKVPLPMPEEESNKTIILSSKKQMQEENKNKKILAEKLLSDEISSCQLTDAEVDEMIEYFKKDIEAMDKELLRIKSSIVGMKNKLAV